MLRMLWRTPWPGLRWALSSRRCHLSRAVVFTGCTCVPQQSSHCCLLSNAQVGSGLSLKVPRLPERLPNNITAARDSGASRVECQDSFALSDDSTKDYVQLPGVPAGFSLPTRVAAMLYSYQVGGHKRDAQPGMR